MSAIITFNTLAYYQQQYGQIVDSAHGYKKIRYSNNLEERFTISYHIHILFEFLHTYINKKCCFGSTKVSFQRKNCVKYFRKYQNSYIKNIISDYDKQVW